MIPAGILFNHATKRYHPILFGLYAMPGGNTVGGRYKSMGHHTEGFDTLQEAEADLASERNRERGVRDYGRSWFWDGGSTPAMVEFFGDAPDKVEPRPPVPQEWLVAAETAGSAPPSP